jgi:hypothetical protein
VRKAVVSEPLPKPWTVEDFLEWEAQQPERYEFIDALILAIVAARRRTPP